MKEFLNINSICFEVRRNIRRKRISVGLDRETGIFYIAAPITLSADEIKHTLFPQINDLMEKIKNKKNRIIIPHKYEDDEKFFYKGVEYPLRRINSDDLTIRFEEGIFYMTVDASGNERKIFETWYKRSLYYELRKLLPAWTKKIKVNPVSVNIKTVKSIWGSCSSKGNLTFSTRLALVPAEILEYVVAHELCHIRHMDHSACFWKELTVYISDCVEKRRYLTDKGYMYKWW